jgi:hypothetical protein
VFVAANAQARQKALAVLGIKDRSFADSAQYHRKEAEDGGNPARWRGRHVE